VSSAAEEATVFFKYPIPTIQTAQGNTLFSAVAATIHGQVLQIKKKYLSFMERTISHISNTRSLSMDKRNLFMFLKTLSLSKYIWGKAIMEIGSVLVNSLHMCGKIHPDQGWK
jgi:hypothetical protein